MRILMMAITTFLQLLLFTASANAASFVPNTLPLTGIVPSRSCVISKRSTPQTEQSTQSIMRSKKDRMSQTTKRFLVHVAAESPPNYGKSPLPSRSKADDGYDCNTKEEEDDDNESMNENTDTIFSLEKLCSSLSASPSDLLSLIHAATDGERGVYTNRSITKDDVLLSIPLSSCIRDDMPPEWYDKIHLLQPESDGDIDSAEEENPLHYNPSEWATRLAASLLELQLTQTNEDTSTSSTSSSNLNLNLVSGRKQWLSMMPNRNYLRASLPIHWPEDIMSSAKCTALELSIDASYFAREGAVSDILYALEESGQMSSSQEYKDMDMETLRSMCHDALDLVQTRSCRVERMDGVQLCPSLRVIAPIFDFINHGSCRHEGDGSANAYFGLEGGSENMSSSSEDSNELVLVVRSRRNIKEGEEVLIDYGDSTRPSWRCLASYGFVPEYRTAASDDTVYEGEEDESVAEVFMNGVRYEVGTHTVPYEMVAAATAAYLEEEGITERIGEEDITLRPEVGLKIARRVSDAAFQLLLEPHTTNETDDDSVESLVAGKLAASLRWSQHKVLLACAVGLRDFAT